MDCQSLLWHRFLGVATTDAEGNEWTYEYDMMGNRISVKDPNIGLWTFGYDKRSLLIWKVDAVGNRTDYAYDKRYRLVDETMVSPAGERRRNRFVYDEARDGYRNEGFQTTAVDDYGSTRYSYAPGGTLRQITRTLNNDIVRGTIEPLSYTVVYKHDTMGRVLSVTYPDGDEIGTLAEPIGYNSAGALQAIPGIVDDVKYNASGLVDAFSYANGTRVNYGYSPSRNWRVSEHAMSEKNAVLYDTSYGYYQDGMLRTRVKGPAWAPAALRASDTYDYDGAKRLVGAAFSHLNQREQYSYSYSAAGNLLRNSENGNAYVYPPPGSKYPYAVVGFEGPFAARSIDYDANGNPLRIGEHSAVWGVDNRLAAHGTSAFRYDANGHRLQKLEGGKVTTYLGSDIEIREGIVTKYLRVAGHLMAKREGRETTWLHTDRLGSVIGSEGPAGYMAAPRRTPYGRAVRGIEGAGRGFTGAEHDGSGLVAMGARYYDPSLGRFVSPDTVVPSMDPHGFNRYAYANNSPLNYVDPTGHYYEAVVGVAVFVGAFILAHPVATAVALVGATALWIGIEDPDAYKDFFSGIRDQGSSWASPFVEAGKWAWGQAENAWDSGLSFSDGFADGVLPLAQWQPVVGHEMAFHLGRVTGGAAGFLGDAALIGGGRRFPPVGVG